MVGSRYSGGTGGTPDLLGMSNAASEMGTRQGESLTKTYNQGFERGTKIKEGQRKSDAMSAFSQAWQSGDMAQLDKVVGMFPEFGKDFQGMIGIRDEQHRQQAATTMMQASTLASTGNCEALRTLAQKNANVLGDGGVAQLNSIADQIANPDTREAAINHLSQMSQGYMVAGMKPSEMAGYMLQQNQNAFNQQMKLKELQMAEQQMRDQSAQGWAQIGLQQAKAGGGGAGGAGVPTTIGQAQAMIDDADQAQRKDAATALILEDNLGAMNDVLKNNKLDPKRMGAMITMLGNGTGINIAMNSDEQKFFSSAREIITAKLRRESGASISNQEWADAFNSYLPQLGDSEGMINTKFNHLSSYGNGLIASAGSAYMPMKLIAQQGGMPRADFQGIGLPEGSQTLGWETLDGNKNTENKSKETKKSKPEESQRFSQLREAYSGIKGGA